jgi:N-acetyl-gamma-glutamyl-phosphate reductase
MIKTGIVGATGYTGSELLRLLYHHPETDIKVITSESKTGQQFSDVHPVFTQLVDHKLKSADEIADMDLDAVFLALPHGVSMEYVKKFEDLDLKIVDLSGDFRLSTPEVYESWYNKEHIYQEGFKESAYGLPELHREQIRQSDLVANPGCYPTASILGLAPLVEGGLIDKKSIIIDAKSGTTGAGVKAKPTTHFSNVNDNFKSYGLKKHRHTVEIEEQLSGLDKEKITVQFTPHLLPLDRGILATIYATPNQKVNNEQLREAYSDFYQDHPFVRLRETAPCLKDVRGTNLCDVFVTYDERTNRIIVISAIDNLVKGSAGAAIQNLNLMFGLDECMGLKTIGMYP